MRNDWKNDELQKFLRNDDLTELERDRALLVFAQALMAENSNVSLQNYRFFCENIKRSDQNMHYFKYLHFFGN